MLVIGGIGADCVRGKPERQLNPEFFKKHEVGWRESLWTQPEWIRAIFQNSYIGRHIAEESDKPSARNDASAIPQRFVS
jgi:hypothetical protein